MSKGSDYTMQESSKSDPQRFSKITSPEGLGMTAAHFEEIRKFCTDNKFPTIFRPINSYVAEKLGSHDAEYVGKLLITKLKSIEEGPAAGDIAMDPAASKIGKDPDKVRKFSFQSEIDIRSGIDTINALTGQKGNLDENLEKLRSNPPMVAVKKQVNHNNSKYDLLYYKDPDNGEILRDNEGRVIYAINVENSLLVYDYGKDKYITCPDISIFSNKNQLEFKIMAYQQFVIKDNAITKNGVKLITADYDILATAGSRGFCLDYDKEGLEIFIKREGLVVDDMEKPNIIAEYELAKAKERSDIISAEINGHSPFIGNVSFESTSVVGYLKEATGGGISHGQETGNLNPEKFTDEPFIAFDSKGEAYMVQGEEGACDFINWQRSKGFPIDVNPKWGWCLDADGQLKVPKEKLNWDDLGKKIEELSSIQKSSETEMEDYASKEINVNLLTLKDLHDSRIKLEKIRLEPPLTYVDLADEGMVHDDIPDRSDLQNQVKKLYAENWEQRFNHQLNFYEEAFKRVSPELLDSITSNWNIEEAKLETNRKISDNRSNPLAQISSKRAAGENHLEDSWTRRVRPNSLPEGNQSTKPGPTKQR